MNLSEKQQLLPQEEVKFYLFQKKRKEKKKKGKNGI